MEQYVGLDVSLKETSVCVMDGSGRVAYRGSVASTPESIAAVVRVRAPRAVRVVLEAGPLSTWHWHRLRALELPVVCVDTRHAKAALSMRVNKTDDNDAEGLAQLGRAGWYREVRVKSLDSHLERSLLAARGQLVKTRRDLENQVRGLLKTFGLLVGKVGRGGFAARVEELLAPAPVEAIAPLLAVRAAVCERLEALDRRVLAAAKASPVCRRLMTAPGVGAITALAFAATVDEPGRFENSAGVGAYLGLTPRRYRSGEVDRAGRISRCGDRMVRSLLFEAANVLLTRVGKSCALKAWGLRLAKRIGAKKAKVAVARKLAVILHRMWMDGADLRWTNEEVPA